MSDEPRVFVVVPAYCEELFIEATILGVPPCVDTILVIDDSSTDRTFDVVDRLGDARTSVIRHETNQGVGAAIYTGYSEALKLGADVIVVMAGDNQMDGSDLESLVAPVLNGSADYAKGNRHQHARANDMPILRRWGSSALARLTSLAMGKRIGDSQCGYTAISRQAALSLNFDQMWKRYGYPNDLLITLSLKGFRISEVPVRPVYADEASGLRPWHMFSILSVIGRCLLREKRATAALKSNYSNEQLMG